MKQLSPEQIKRLKDPLPPEAVKPHPTKTFLSSIKAIYEVERLNEVFGIGSWQLRSSVIDATTPMIVIKAILTIPEYGIELESYGGNDNGGENSKNHDLGDAYKGATTDAFTKICSFLEIGIDVFKGKNTPTKTPESKNGEQSEDNRPWMTEKDLIAVQNRITAGQLDAYDKADKAFRMKKEYRAKLKEQLMQPS